MSKLKDVIKAWEEKNQKPAGEATEMKLYYQNPPIEKMDSSLAVLKNCRHLSLSTNRIDKIAGLQGLERLEILSLGRNLIKKIEGLEFVASTLKQLWLSYNNIDKLGPVCCCLGLTTLYISHNNIDKWAEVDRLVALPNLTDLSLIGNPIEINAGPAYRSEVGRRLPNIRLDGLRIDQEQPAAAAPAEGEGDATATATATGPATAAAVAGVQ
ncbi:putative Dynein light chain 1; axonemal [Paratrimastix pyriformis]|uniref:Dynein axonemal light chain 1 n=1 Tax=Paratrimastix pyriformis TaxID=342808 RepID=A0ABQ8U8J6_9EUKA|nr:putative Dynein light chain 1; axonemal [Paratrimastix pyriformis]